MSVYVLLAVLTFLLGSATGVYGLYHVSYLILGIALLIRWIHYNGRKNVQVNRELEEERIFSGEAAKVTLTITNAGAWPIFWLSYDETIPHRLHTPPSLQGVSSLLPGEQMQVEYILQGNRRGFYPLGPLILRLGDGLGWQEESIQYLTEQRLIVYPRIVPLEELGLPSRIVFGDLIWPQRIYHDPARIRGLREYQVGDSMKDIYWPATASQGQLMVKEYDSTITVENMIFLNLNLKDYKLKGLEPRIELAVEAAASIAQYLTQHHQIVGLATNGLDPLNGVQSVLPGQGNDHLMKIMEVLARVEMAEDSPFLPILAQYRHQMTPGSTLLVITATDSEELIHYVLDLCRQGLNVVILVIGDQVQHLSYVNRLYTENLVIYVLHRKEDIYGWGE